MADYVNPGVVAGIGFDNFFRQQKADQIEAAKQELESHINALKLKAAQQDVEDQQVAKLQKRAIAEESQLMPGDYVPPDMQERRKAANLPPLREKVLPGLDEAQGPTQQGATLADPARIYMPVQAELAQQKAAEQQQMAEQQAAKSQAMQAARVAASQAPDRMSAARILLEAGDDPKLVDSVWKSSTPETQPVFSVDPTTGQVEQTGSVPKGARFVNKPAPKAASGGGGKANGGGAASLALLTPEAADFDAKAFLSSGIEPAYGSGTVGATNRGVFKNAVVKAAQEMGVSGQDLSEIRMRYKAKSGAAGQLEKTYQGTEAFSETAKENLKLLDDVLNKIPDSNLSFMNALTRGFGRATGNTDISSFDTYRRSVANEFARIISQVNGGVLTDSARKEVDELVKPNASVGQIRASIDALRQEAANRTKTYEGRLEKMYTEGSGKNASAVPPDDRQKRIDAVKAKYGLK